MNEAAAAEIERRLSATERTTQQLAAELDHLLRVTTIPGAGAVPGKCPRKVRGTGGPPEHGTPVTALMPADVAIATAGEGLRHHPQQVVAGGASPSTAPLCLSSPPAPEGFTQTELGESAMPLVHAALREVWPHVHGTTATGQAQNQIDIQNSFGRASALSTASGGTRRCMVVENSIDSFPALMALTSACTMTSTSFWTIFRAFSSSTPPHTRREPCSTWCPVLPHADWCLQSDVMPNLGAHFRLVPP